MDRHAWNERYRGKDLVWSAEPNRFLAAEAQGLAPGRALDLAAGEGRNAIWLAEQGWDVDAVDFSSVAIEKGRRLAEQRGVSSHLEPSLPQGGRASAECQPGVRWIEADLLTYVPDEASYDLVLVFYLHLPWNDMQTVIARTAQALAPAGTFLLVGHDRSNLEQGYGGPPDARVLYTPEQVASALGSGVEIEKAQIVTRDVSTDDGPRQAIDNLVRAVRRCGT